MRLLVDSHAFVWFVEGNPRISRPARAAIEENAEEVWVSYASIWELTIKQAVSRMTLPESPEAMATKAGMQLLPIELRHIRLTATLEHLHGDPFDRLLVAQAIDEGLVLVTSDRTVQRYPVAWLW
jgi:PIN domain nuclease of toxin-antitoxin system